MIRLGIAIEETWRFFNEIYDDFQAHYQTSLFEQPQVNIPFFKLRLKNYLFQRRLLAFMQAHDVVFFEWASRLLVTASHLPKQCKIVTRLHRYELYQWVDQVNWDAVDKIIMVSRARQREFVARFPNQAHKIVISSPSTSLSKFTAPAKVYSGDLGILCHLTPRKRVYDLILTFYELAQQRAELKLHIGGGPHPAYLDYHQALHYLVQQLGLEERVIFYGEVMENWKWYHNIDLFISNSYSEGLQVSPMEAMASGCYCLSHYWDGADELLPETNLFYTGQQLQALVLNYCRLPMADKQALRQEMRQWAQDHFDINLTRQQIRQVIEAVVTE